MYQDVIISGYGGQGILMIGNLLSIAAMGEGKHVTYYPVYGVEMRGGAASCTVVMSSYDIGSPIVGNPMSVIAMNQASLDVYEEKVKEGGALVVNSSLCDLGLISRDDITVVPVSANELADQLGSQRLASMVALGAYVEKVAPVDKDFLIECLPRVISKRYEKFISLNRNAIEEGAKSAGG